MSKHLRILRDRGFGDRGPPGPRYARADLLAAIGADGGSARVARRRRARLVRAARGLCRTPGSKAMTQASRVLVAIRVNATPARAFAAFTEEIGQWWRPNGLFQFTRRRDGGALLRAGRERPFDRDLRGRHGVRRWRRARLGSATALGRDLASRELRPRSEHPSCTSASRRSAIRRGSPSSTSAGIPSPNATPRATVSRWRRSSSASPSGGRSCSTTCATGRDSSFEILAIGSHPLGRPSGKRSGTRFGSTLFSRNAFAPAST